MEIKIKSIISILLLICSLGVASAFAKYTAVTNAGKKVEQFAIATEDFLQGHGEYSASDLYLNGNETSSELISPNTELLKYRIESLSRSAKVISMYKDEILKSFASYPYLQSVNAIQEKIFTIINVLLEQNTPYFISAMVPIIDAVKKIPGYQDLPYNESIASLAVTSADQHAITKLNEVIYNFNHYIVSNNDGCLALDADKRKAFFEYVALNSDAIAINEANLIMQYDALQLLNETFLKNNSYETFLELSQKHQLSLELTGIFNKDSQVYKIYSDSSFDAIISGDLAVNFKKAFNKLLENRKRTLNLLMLVTVY